MSNKQFVRFCIVGTVGFVTDTSVLFVVTRFLPIGPAEGRFLSFLVAATVTWLLNRHITFSDSRTSWSSQWMLYLIATSAGGAVNIFSYRAWIRHAGTSDLHLFIGVAIGSIAALLFNYLVSKRLVFKI